jgi:hypothetical protein
MRTKLSKVQMGDFITACLFNVMYINYINVMDNDILLLGLCELY